MTRPPLSLSMPSTTPTMTTPTTRTRSPRPETRLPKTALPQPPPSFQIRRPPKHCHVSSPDRRAAGIRTRKRLTPDMLHKTRAPHVLSEREHQLQRPLHPDEPLNLRTVTSHAPSSFFTSILRLTSHRSETRQRLVASISLNVAARTATAVARMTCLTLVLFITCCALHPVAAVPVDHTELASPPSNLPAVNATLYISPELEAARSRRQQAQEELALQASAVPQQDPKTTENPPPDSLQQPQATHTNSSSETPEPSQEEEAAALQEAIQRQRENDDLIKYFHEMAPIRADVDHRLTHYDARFFQQIVQEEQVRRQSQRQMVHAFFEFMNSQGLETWIAHGTLLGWWWNGKILPWDWDVDVQVSEAALFKMAKTYNNTCYTSHNPTVALGVCPEGAESIDPSSSVTTYLLDVNPHAVLTRLNDDGLNIIDARWIDTRTGLYIDITGLSVLDPVEAPEVLWCKNFHGYHAKTIYPLRPAILEGAETFVPYMYTDILRTEYGNQALIERSFEGHEWNDELGQWLAKPADTSVTAEDTPTAEPTGETTPQDSSGFQDDLASLEMA